MKTIAKTLIAVGILMFSLHVNAAISGGPGSQQIGYKVQILGQNPHINNFNLILYVAMTDENGRPVDQVQRFKTGTYTYFFSETGPVQGTRVARLVNDPIVPTTLNFYCAPDAQTGKFLPGDIYVFDLYPSITGGK